MSHFLITDAELAAMSIEERNETLDFIADDTEAAIEAMGDRAEASFDESAAMDRYEGSFGW